MKYFSQLTISFKATRFVCWTVIFAVIVQLTAATGLSEPVTIPIATQQAIDYQNISSQIWCVNQIFALLLPVLLLIFGWGSRISSKINTLAGGSRYIKLLISAAIFFLLSWMIQLPLLRIRDNAFNQLMNTVSQPLFQWITVQFLEWLAFAVGLILSVLIIYWLMAKSPRRWQLWATGIFSFLVLIFLVGEPLAGNYKPLGDSPLEVKISEITGQVGIPRSSIVLDDCNPVESCDDGRVIGLGPTRLMILNAGLFQTRPEEWTIQTVAHEAKHFTKDDNIKGFLVIAAMFLVCFWLLDKSGGFMISKFSERIGFTSLGQPASLPLVVLILTVLYLIALPPINMFRQRVEFEADRYGLELTHNNKALAKMVAGWTTESKYRVPDPNFFYMLFRSSHPSDAERISFANDYHPWLNENIPAAKLQE